MGREGRSRSLEALLHTVSATVATLIAVAFSLSALDRYLDTRRRHQLMWTIALAMFAAGSLSLFLGAAVGWNAFTYKSFYLFGAILNVPFLALGTVYLLGGMRRGDRITAVVSLLAAFATGMIVTAPLLADLDPAVLPQGSAVFGVGPRIAAAVASGLGAIVIFVGAVWSVVSLLRSRPPGAGRLAAANVCIATGTLVLSFSGLLNSVFDEMDAFAVTLAVGITIIFGGFLLTNRRSTDRPVVAWHPADEVSATLGAGPSRSSLVGARPRT